MFWGLFGSEQAAHAFILITSRLQRVLHMLLAMQCMQVDPDNTVLMH
jgi:hypothetical protein